MRAAVATDLEASSKAGVHGFGEPRQADSLPLKQDSADVRPRSRSPWRYRLSHRLLTQPQENQQRLVGKNRGGMSPQRQQKPRPAPQSSRFLQPRSRRYYGTWRAKQKCSVPDRLELVSPFLSLVHELPAPVFGSHRSKPGKNCRATHGQRLPGWSADKESNCSGRKNG